MKLRSISMVALVAIVTISSIDSRGGGGHVGGGYRGGSYGRGYGRGYGAGAFATGVALGAVATADGNNYDGEEYIDDNYEPEPALITYNTKRGFDNPIYNNETEVGHEYGPREFYYHKAKDSRR